MEVGLGRGGKLTAKSVEADLEGRAGSKPAWNGFDENRRPQKGRKKPCRGSDDNDLGENGRSGR